MARWELAWGLIPLGVLAGAAQGQTPSLFEDAAACVQEDEGGAKAAFALASLCLANVQAREEDRLAAFVTGAPLMEGGADGEALDAQQRLAERHAQIRTALDRYAPAFTGEASGAAAALHGLAEELRQLP